MNTEEKNLEIANHAWNAANTLLREARTAYAESQSDKSWAAVEGAERAARQAEAIFSGAAARVSQARETADQAKRKENAVTIAKLQADASRASCMEEMDPAFTLILSADASRRAALDLIKAALGRNQILIAEIVSLGGEPPARTTFEHAMALAQIFISRATRLAEQDPGVSLPTAILDNEALALRLAEGLGIGVEYDAVRTGTMSAIAQVECFLAGRDVASEIARRSRSVRGIIESVKAVLG